MVARLGSLVGRYREIAIGFANARRLGQEAQRKLEPGLARLSMPIPL